MIKTLLAAAAIVSLSTAAMADPVQLTNDRLGEVAGGTMHLPTSAVTTIVSMYEVNSSGYLGSESNALAIGTLADNVAASAGSNLQSINTTSLNGM